MGELAMLALSAFGIQAMVVWRKWLDRNPVQDLTALLASHMASPPPPPKVRGVSALFFSKDRPFQLKECLRTFNKFARSSTPIQQFVLYKSDIEELRNSYDFVAAQFPSVKFVEETLFQSDFLNILDQTTGDIVMLCVDDALFLRPLSFPHFEEALQERVCRIHLRLHPHISFSQPANQSCIPPSFKLSEELAFFKAKDGTVDWNYPWDLSAALYRKIDLIDTINRISSVFGLDGLSHPNKLELTGNKIWNNMSPAACPTAPSCVLITVNRVQDICPNSVYEQEGADYSIEMNVKLKCFSDSLRLALNQLLRDGRELDEAYYADREWNSAHIGAFVLK